jgi:hypothetical protein
MIQNFTKVKPDGHDNFVRLFKRVMADSELTPLQKIILSDVISLQIQGKRYFKTSKALSTELGNVTKKVSLHSGTSAGWKRGDFQRWGSK